MDWFDDSPASKPYIGENGQRIATVLTYLSTPEAGGETIFPDAENGPLTTPAKKVIESLFDHANLRRETQFCSGMFFLMEQRIQRVCTVAVLLSLVLNGV